jgi:hypothetical protein
MTTKSPGRLVLIAMFAIATHVASSSAQEAAGTGQNSHSAAEAQGGEKYRLPEAEFVASPSFRSGSLVQPLWRDLSVEGHYFGGDENNIGFTGGSWTFHGEGWKVVPGFGVAFGDNGFRTMPALSFRWGYERSWFISEGLYVQGLLHTNFFPEGTEPEPGHPASELAVPSIADGNHVSARWRRLTIGGTWEHMQFREGREWKGGLRVAYRVLPSLSFTFFALGPGGEIRGGILLQPEEKK